ncbi:DUF11 domain-containing protein, partial [Parapedobacter defluvii]|uniref:DUF11 domain-containing protein n=1 Tax=Parapedobacter defluvii TaxID=2045106 RepID=UPI00166DB9F2
LSGTELYLLDELSTGQAIKSIASTDVTVNGAADADGFFTVTANADIAAGATFTLTVTADVAADIAADEVSNTIHIWADDPAGDYSTPDGTATTPDYPVDRDYGFDDDAIEKIGTFSNGVLVNAVAGEEYTYTVTVTNQGPSDIAAGTVIYFQDLVSPGQTLTGISYQGSPVAFDASTGRFALPVSAAVPVGGSFSFEVTVNVDAGVTGTIENTIRIWQDDPGATPPTPDGEKTTDPIPVDQLTDLSVLKTVDNTAPYVGSNVVFTIVASNNGPSDATGVVVTDELPSGYEYVSSDASAGTFDAAANTWTVGGLANGASETLTLTARVLAAGDYINYASVDGDEHDPDGDNNEDTPDD